MVYALIYTLFLGLGLQIDSCLTLALTPLNDIASPRELTVTYYHILWRLFSYNLARFPVSQPLFSTFAFTGRRYTRCTSLL